jgi:hypothetical protein
MGFLQNKREPEDDRIFIEDGPDKNAYPNIDLTYYYDRERYLENAPSQVRTMREAGRPRKGGFLRSLTDTKPKLLLFITIAVLCAAILIINYALP